MSPPYDGPGQTTARRRANVAFEPLTLDVLAGEPMSRPTRVVGTLIPTAAAIAYLVWKIELGTTLDVLRETDLGWFAAPR